MKQIEPVFRLKELVIGLNEFLYFIALKNTTVSLKQISLNVPLSLQYQNGYNVSYKTIASEIILGFFELLT